MLSLVSKAQVGNAPTNDYSAWTSSTYSMSVANSTRLFGSDHWSNKSRLIDGDTGNYASWTAVLLGSSWIEARNATGTSAQFPIGSYAGFVVGDLDLISLGASMKVTTYLNGTEQESKNFPQLIGTILDGGKRRIGLVTTKPYNRIRLTVNAGLTLMFTARAYYAEVLVPTTTAGSTLACNTSTSLVRNSFGAIIEPSRTRIEGVSIGAVLDENNVTDSNTGNYATLSLNASVGGSAHLSVRNLGSSFPATTFAGFEVENANLISLTAFSTITIRTYLNGVYREGKRADDGLWLTLPLLDYQNRYILGFESTMSFDEIHIEIKQPLGIALGVTKVYRAVVKKPCEGLALVCNQQTNMLDSTYPVNISSTRTGVSGVVSAAATVVEPDNVLDNNLNNYAQIKVPVSALTSGSISVLKSLSNYPVGTYAGFDIQNANFLNVQFLNNISLKSYKDGVLQETVTGNGILLGAGSDLIASTGRAILGFVAKKEFDELQISVTNGLNIDLGVIKVYRMVVMKTCPKTIDCNSSYYWNQPDFPVVLNAQRTGLSTLACVGCSINNPDNIIDNNPNNYARITLAVGIGNKASISVMDPTATYPQGTYAGFTVKDRYFLVQGDLVEFTVVKTYLNGVLQESKTGADLFDLSLLIPIWGTGTRNIGFHTTKPFNEVQIETLSLANIINITDVYGAVIDTRGSNGGGLDCTAVIDAVNDTMTINAGNTGTVSVLTNDTYNGSPATLSNVTITQLSTTNSGVNVNPNTGLVTVAPGTPAGNYTITYKICDQVTPNNCDQATVSVTVPAVINAVNDNYNMSGSGGTTPSVLLNDTVNGQPATITNVNLSLVSAPAGFVLNPDGTITVPSGTAPGNYPVVYQICDVLNPTTNCSMPAIATITIAGSLDLALEISSSVASIIVNRTFADIFYTVTNVGSTATTGSITLTANNVLGLGNFFNPATPPTGWTLTAQTGNTYTYTTNNVLAPGANAVFVFNYFTSVLIPQQMVVFNGTVSTAGDGNATNNSDSVTITVLNQ